ncbi:hypothetical protein TWF594_011276 [Orbilia oligospora]|nr:hypothetical protein TWF594_011276 [Orbilia oligospora]
MGGDVLQESQRLEGGAVCTLRGTSSSEASISNYVYKRSWNGTTDFIIGFFFSWEISRYVTPWIQSINTKAPGSGYTQLAGSRQRRRKKYLIILLV